MPSGAAEALGERGSGSAPAPAAPAGRGRASAILNVNSPSRHPQAARFAPAPGRNGPRPGGPRRRAARLEELAEGAGVGAGALGVQAGLRAILPHQGQVAAVEVHHGVAGVARAPAAGSRSAPGPQCRARVVHMAIWPARGRLPAGPGAPGARCAEVQQARVRAAARAQSSQSLRGCLQGMLQEGERRAVVAAVPPGSAPSRKVTLVRCQVEPLPGGSALRRRARRDARRDG